LHNIAIYFISGVDQEGSKHLFPDAPYDIKEKFFFKETNEHIAVWEGEKLTKDRALAVSGIKQCIGCRFEKFCLNLTL
jgi:Xaa-Pro aminopeptidase